MNQLREAPGRRAEYRHFRHITTRWLDNDAYGHVNNVVYYEWFDTVVNEYLIGLGALDPVAGSVIGVVGETHCRYFSVLSFPQDVEAGMRVARMGTSSVRYEIAIFADNADTASAQGYFIHVYVDRASRRPTPLTPTLRAALTRILA